MAANYNSLQQPVLTSLSISAKDDDSFFSPTRLGHTGYAYDGFMYSAGIRNSSQKATWYTETPSPTRGSLATFPTQAVIVVSGGSLTILEAEADVLTPWMIFFYCDTFAFPNNFPGTLVSFSARSASWASGRLTIVLAADPGAIGMTVALLTLDFASDSSYIDYPALAS